MALMKSPEEKSLKELLDGIILSQQKDIYSYSGGHLNEANLWKPPDQSTHRSWKSAKKPCAPLIPKSTNIKTKEKFSQNGKMRDSIVNFSLGSSGVVPLPPVSLNPCKESKASSALSNVNRMPQNTPKYDGVLVEELQLPEVMLRNPDYSTPDKNEFFSEATSNDASKFMPKRDFITGFQTAITKKDQFSKMKTFETKILKMQEGMEKSALHSSKAVENLEMRLRENLSYLASQETAQSSASLKRLETYSKSFEETIESLPTFKYTLDQIKQEYDDYISYLMNSEEAKHQRLQKQMDVMTSRGTSNQRILHFEADRVNDLESQAKDLLNENERLRRELQEEMDLANEPVEEKKKNYIPPIKEQRGLELIDQIEETHSSILERLDQITQIRTELTSDYVPSTVCTHLEQCIKETEVETQRLISQKDYFERSVTEMGNVLQDAIENADTTEKDAKKVWKKINAVKSTDNDGIQKVMDSDAETDEEAKWSWYIS